MYWGIIYTGPAFKHNISIYTGKQYFHSEKYQRPCFRATPRSPKQPMKEGNPHTLSQLVASRLEVPFSGIVALPYSDPSWSTAIDTALYHIRDQPEKQFIIYSDSLSVLRSLKNLDHRNPLIQQILRKYNYLSSFKEIVFCWLPSHTNIRGNELADLEVKSALSLSITNLKIPHSDFKSNIHQYVLNKCQSVWEKQTENKLHELKPDFNSKCSFLAYSRQIQTKITRCRIGHTRLTHAYLLTNEQPPFCISCNEPFTVKHFLISCTEFNYIRKKYFTSKTVKELFSDTSSDKIINFLPIFLTSCN